MASLKTLCSTWTKIGGLATPEEVDSPRAPRSGCWHHVEGEEPAGWSPTEVELPTIPTEEQPSRQEDYPVHECGSPTEEATPDLHDGIPKAEQEWLALQTRNADDFSPDGTTARGQPFRNKGLKSKPQLPRLMTARPIGHYAALASC